MDFLVSLRVWASPTLVVLRSVTVLLSDVTASVLVDRLAVRRVDLGGGGCRGCLGTLGRLLRCCEFRVLIGVLLFQGVDLSLLALQLLAQLSDLSFHRGLDRCFLYRGFPGCRFFCRGRLRR